MKVRACQLPRLLIAAAFLFLGVPWAGAQEAEPAFPAFPGAEGFGAFTVGGRGGTVYLVTTLADYGADEEPIEGSLRAAVEAEGPRMVVFRVAGYIELKRTLDIRHPYLTLAGQSAPGEGVTLKNYGVEVYAPEVILRYLRVRPGDVASTEQDAINVRSRNVIIDHCSVSWGTDETLSVIGAATNVTVQWCLITESLNNSIHHKGPHGYGTLLTTTGDVTIHHSAYAFHNSRNPRPKDVLLDFRNNLVYGYGDQAGYNYADFTRMNYVGNYIIPLAHSRNSACAFNLGGTNARFFVDGNRLRKGEQEVRDWDLICTPENLPHEEANAQVDVPTPFAAPSVGTDPAEEGYRQVLEGAGATLPVRDAVDERVLALIQAGEGRIIDSQAEVGGWPPLMPAPPPYDADRDGMPDAWEAQHGLDPADGSDHAGDLDDDGYTNLEEFLNDTDPTEPFRWVPPPLILPASGTAFTDAALTITIVPAMPVVPVHYTLDGSEPTAASPRYEGPIRLATSTHVRAKTIQEDRPTTAAFAHYEKLIWHVDVEETTSPLKPGLRYTYYEADDWDDGPLPEALAPVATGDALHVDFSLRQRDDCYALLFEGYLNVPQDGIYAFYFEDNYRGHLYIDEAMVTIGRTDGHPPGQVALRKGWHTFHLRSLHERPEQAVLQWEGPGIERQAIPGTAFSQTAVTQ